MDVLPPSPLSTQQEREDVFSSACIAWEEDASAAAERSSWSGVGWGFLHMPQDALFLQFFELCPLLRQPKHRLLSNTNLFFSSAGLLESFWHLWMEWLSPQHRHVTGLEENADMLTFLDPFESFELFSTTLFVFILDIDLSDVSAFTFVLNALAFGRFTSLSGLSSGDFKAWKDVTGLQAMSASFAKKSANSLKLGYSSVCRSCFVTWRFQREVNQSGSFWRIFRFSSQSFNTWSPLMWGMALLHAVRKSLNCLNFTDFLEPIFDQLFNFSLYAHWITKGWPYRAFNASHAWL